MISAANVTRFEMDVTIFDLDRLREYRKTELSVGRHEDQLFSFDGLLPNTWFAMRIEYRLFYHSSDGGYSDFPTKQELIVRTKNDSLTSPFLIDDKIISIEEVVTDEKSVNITVSTVFASKQRLSTLIVPELRCEKGTVKPPAQRVLDFAKIHFDLRKIIRNNNRYENPHCSTICVFPFVRAEVLETGQQTFRGREWCGSLQEALELLPSETAPDGGIDPENPSNAAISTKPTYSALRSNIIRFTPESMQCKLYCRGTACKYFYYYNFAMPDFGISNVHSLLNTIKVMSFASQQGKIAIHCHAGLGRTCTLIACYLVWSRCISADAAIKIVRSKRPKSIQSPRQILLVEQLAALMEKQAVALPLEEGLSLSSYLVLQNDFIPSEETRRFSHIPKLVFHVCDRLLNLVFEGQVKYITPRGVKGTKHNVRECTIGKIAVEWKTAFSSKGRAQTRYVVNILARISTFPFEQDESVKEQFQTEATVVNITKILEGMDASRLVHLLNYYMQSIKKPYCEKKQLISVFENFSAEEQNSESEPKKEEQDSGLKLQTWQCLVFYLLNVLSYLTGENYEVCSTLVAGWIFGPHCPELKATVHNYMRDLFARNLREQEQQSRIRNAFIAEQNEKRARDQVLNKEAI
ncbi:hypothetical protein FO519_000429 [Halicephalobus sp. NKZ332]|nr:hypothetical protein FO519_000429 [Halicephalobus sp. NKZ332]